ncbi:MAG: methyltransferase domain-containing protein [Candidatus Hydrogenedentes bacterium]|nr:methyltransferase domain-containing protein [Candidatus Hydrogenedentota bacterium]
MERVPEPELMDDPNEAEAYAITDFSDVNEKFVERFAEFVFEHYGITALEKKLIMVDLGCGPGDITNRVKLKFPRAVVIGIDGSPSMLEYARNNYRNSSIEWVLGDAKTTPFLESSVDIFFSNSLLHHLLDPTPFWIELSRVVKKGGIIFLRDLYRPNSPYEARKIVEMYAGDATELLKEEYFRSLLASFTPEEVVQQLDKTGFKDFRVEKVTDRHIDIYGMVNLV